MYYVFCSVVIVGIVSHQYRSLVVLGQAPQYGIAGTDFYYYSFY